MKIRPSELGVDAILVVNQGSWVMDPSFFHLTGIRAWPMEGSAAVLSEDELVVLTSRLEEEAAKRYVENVVVTEKGLKDAIRKAIEPYERVGINARYLSCWARRKILPRRRGYVDVSKALAELRVVKDEGEIAEMRRAVEAAIEGFLNSVGKLREGMTECQFAGILNAAMMEAGAQDRAFQTIVAFGENSALPHHTCSERRLRRGDVVLVDFGARLGIYNSDLTRTFFFGEPEGILARAWNVVDEAVDLVLEKGQAGMSGAELDSIARKLIDSHLEFRGRFIHSLGHCLGIEVHDPCAISRRRKKPIPEGTVFTVEPGIYLPGVGGIRLEEDVVARSGGLEVLSSKLPRFMTASEYL